jgi:hypothetical protein
LAPELVKCGGNKAECSRVISLGKVAGPLRPKKHRLHKWKVAGKADTFQRFFAIISVAEIIVPISVHKLINCFKSEGLTHMAQRKLNMYACTYTAYLSIMSCKIDSYHLHW